VEKEIKIPYKYFSSQVNVHLKCKVIYIDFEGRVDGNSIRNILPQVAPRKLVFNPPNI
jgi:cleavage and polyadenylation specificity factor subunit 2